MIRKLTALISLVLALGLVTSTVYAAPKGGRLKIAGSTTVLPLSQVWVEAFAKKNANSDISVSGGGTGTGISMLLNGTCDIANASRDAQKKEYDAAKSRNSKLVETKLAKDGLAIIVHPSNNVSNLTIDQIARIYKGSINNWKDAGGGNKGIVAIGRDTSSGTYGFFQEAVLNGSRYRKDMLALASNAAVAQAVAQSEGAIGYVGLAFAKEAQDAKKVKIISVSRKTGEAGLKPSDETIKSGKYPLFRYLYAYTLGAPKGLAAEFLKFATSSEGQAMVHSAGYLPLN